MIPHKLERKTNMTKTNKTATPTVRRVAILGGNRIPFARSNTVYSNASNQDMFTATLQGLVDRFNLHGERLGEVVGGAVMKHARDFNLVRESVLSTTLSRDTPAFDIQQACGTGLEATRCCVPDTCASAGVTCGRSIHSAIISRWALSFRIFVTTN